MTHTHNKDATSAGVRVRFMVLELGSHPEHVTFPKGMEMQELAYIDPDTYRDMHRDVGQDCLWWMRRVMTDHELDAILTSSHLHVYQLTHNSKPVGFVEIDTSLMPRVSINYIGLVPSSRGCGLGMTLLKWAVWMCHVQGARFISLNTSNADHPRALQNYMAAGFQQVFQTDEIWTIPKYLKMTIPDDLKI